MPDQAKQSIMLDTVIRSVDKISYRLDQMNRINSNLGIACSEVRGKPGLQESKANQKSSFGWFFWLYGPAIYQHFFGLFNIPFIVNIIGKRCGQVHARFGPVRFRHFVSAAQIRLWGTFDPWRNTSARLYP